MHVILINHGICFSADYKLYGKCIHACDSIALECVRVNSVGVTII